MNKVLQDEYAKLHTEANAVLANVAKEGRVFTAEEKANQEARFARMDTIKAQADEEKKLAAYAFEAGKTEEIVSKAERDFSKHFNGGKAITAHDAINCFMRGGDVPREQFALTTGTNSSIMLPKDVLSPLLVLKNVNAWRTALAAVGYRPLESTAATQAVVPVWNDLANTGTTISESATSDVQADSDTTSSVTLNPVLYSSKSKWFSNTMIQAESFDVLSYVAPILSKMIDKAEEAAWTANAKALAGTYTYTGASVTTLTYSDVLNWEHSLPVAYRYDAVFVISDALYKAVRGLVDSNNRPIMDLDPTNVFQGKLHGKPVIVSDYFDSPLTSAQASSSSGVSKVGGAFVSGQAIIMRDIVPQRLTRYVNVPTYKDQTGYEIFANADCQFVDAGTSLFKFKTS